MDRNRTVFLAGEHWLIRFNDLHGECLGHCDFEAREFVIDSNLRGNLLLGTMLHEFLHKLFPQYTEPEILRLESELSVMILAAIECVAEGEE